MYDLRSVLLAPESTFDVILDVNRRRWNEVIVQLGHIPLFEVGVVVRFSAFHKRAQADEFGNRFAIQDIHCGLETIP